MLLRPPVRFLGSTSDFSGVSLVMSWRDTTVWKRRVGVVGLYVLIAILDLREIRHLLAVLQFHVSLLPVRAVAHESSPAAHLAFHVRRPHFGHFHFEQFLDGLLHLNLVGVRSDFKAQRALVVFFCDTFFRHQRPAN